ncbi:MAG: indole-3-glycerol phosphate synthase TrpC [Actinomycetota bacterium]
MTYLDQILAWHRRRAESDERDPVDLLTRAQTAASSREANQFVEAINSGSQLNVIAEIKRRSPSKGDIALGLDPARLAREYAEGGAACLSVLTDEPHFGGSADDLIAARTATRLPVLRKDFVVDDRDVMDACLMGAHAVLLIVSALTDRQLHDLLRLAESLKLNALVEVHDADELARGIDAGATLLGVNQRDLRSFVVDTHRAEELARHFPAGITAVAESGITGADDAVRCAAAGYRAILVGEHLVRHHNRAGALSELRVALPS